MTPAEGWTGVERRSNLEISSSKVIQAIWNALPYIVSLVAVYLSINNKLIVVGEQLEYAKKEISTLQESQKAIITELGERRTNITLFTEKFKDNENKISDVVIEIKGINYKLVELDKKLDKNRRDYNAMPE